MNIEIGELESFSTRNTEDGPMQVRTSYWAVIATAEDGRRWVLIGDFLSEAEARKARWVFAGPLADPEAWSEMEPVYGSASWGIEAERNLACFEADAFDEPRPNW